MRNGYWITLRSCIERFGYWRDLLAGIPGLDGPVEMALLALFMKADSPYYDTKILESSLWKRRTPSNREH